MLQSVFILQITHIQLCVNHVEDHISFRMTAYEENGDVIGVDVRVVERWKEYFEGLLQGGIQQQDSHRQPYGELRQEESGEQSSVTVEEVEAAIRKLKNDKAPGTCGTSAELLKVGNLVVVEWLHKIISIAWSTGKAPEDWRRAVIIPIHKKGSRTECSNY